MTNAVWIQLIQSIPASLQNQIVLVTDSRAEIAVESVFRYEPDFVVVRGRMAGTTDGGLLFMIPYGRLTAMMVAKEIKEAEVHKIFDGASEAETVHGSSVTKPEIEDIESTPSKPMERLSGSKSGTPKPKPSTESSIAARNTLLDKLRAAKSIASGT
jgi:hypothetical protein